MTAPTLTAPIPLIDLGVVHAPIADELRAAFERVFTSPLVRAIDTCRLAGLASLAEVREELFEWDYGEYEGRTTDDIREERAGWSLWRDGCPGGERVADVGSRVDTLLTELRTLSGAVALFAHGHVLRVLAARWIGLPP